MYCRSLFVLFLLAIVLFVLLLFTDSDYPFGIFKLFLPHINTIYTFWNLKIVTWPCDQSQGQWPNSYNRHSPTSKYICMQNIKAPSLKTNKFFKHSCKKENNYLTFTSYTRATKLKEFASFKVSLFVDTILSGAELFCLKVQFRLTLWTNCDIHLTLQNLIISRTNIKKCEAIFCMYYSISRSNERWKQNISCRFFILFKLNKDTNIYVVLNI
jgi:hypothetical protein